MSTVSASGLRKPRLGAHLSAPCPQDSASRTLLERLEVENRKLRAVVDELMLQIRALRDQSQSLLILISYTGLALV